MTGGRRQSWNEAKQRRYTEQQIAEAQAAPKTEVAAVHALHLSDDERAERLALVRLQIRTEISGLKAEPDG